MPSANALRSSNRSRSCISKWDASGRVTLPLHFATRPGVLAGWGPARALTRRTNQIIPCIERSANEDSRNI
jgi:hypothetical protein